MELSFEKYVSELAPTAKATEKPTIFLLTCIDYRYAHRIVDLMDSEGLRRKYDTFSLAGAAAGANQVPEWREVLVNHIRVAREIGHPIARLIILEHRDCGAYKKFFGLEWAKVLPPEETAAHLREVAILIESLKAPFGDTLKIDSFLLARDEDDPLKIDAHDQ